MVVKALTVFDFVTGDRTVHMNNGDILTITDVNQAQSLINSGCAVEVEQCQQCGSYSDKR